MPLLIIDTIDNILSRYQVVARLHNGVTKMQLGNNFRNTNHAPPTKVCMVIHPRKA